MTGGAQTRQEHGSRDVALFIDWDNIKLSVLDAMGRSPDLQALKKAAQKYGRHALARAYANWPDSRYKGDAAALYNQGIEPVFVLSHVDSQTSEVLKNSADVRMAIDCIQLALTNPHLTTLVLVSGDNDFLHVVNTAKALGKRVAVIAASRSVAYPMTYVPDDFRLYEELVSGFVGDLKGERAYLIQEALKALEECVREIHSSGRENTLADVKVRIRERIPDFREEDLGFSGFAYFAFTAERERLARVDATHQPPRIYPIEETTIRDGEPLLSAVEWAALIQWVKKQVGPSYQTVIEKAINDQSMLSSFPSTKPGRFVDIAIQSGVLTPQKEWRYNIKDRKGYWHHDLRLNEYNPRVQVYLGLTEARLLTMIVPSPATPPEDPTSQEGAR